MLNQNNQSPLSGHHRPRQPVRGLTRGTPFRLPTTLPCRARYTSGSVLQKLSDPSGDLVACPNSLPIPQSIDNHEDRYVATWRDHVPSTGSRRPATQGKGSFRGSTIDDAGREILFESTYEWAAAQSLLVDRRVQHIQDQARPAHYRDDVGEEHHTVFDFVVTTVDGKRHALAIKPERRREASGIEQVVELVRKQCPHMAATFSVRTEFDVSRSATHNATLIRRSRRLRVEDDVQGLTAIVDSLRGTMTIANLLGLFRNDARGFTAVVNLIDEGRLIPAEPGRITPGLKVQPAA